MGGFFNRGQAGNGVVALDRLSNIGLLRKVSILQDTTTFTIEREVKVGEYLLVYLNGVLLNEGVEFTINGKVITTNGLKIGDVVQYAYVATENAYAISESEINDIITNALK